MDHDRAGQPAPDSAATGHGPGYETRDARPRSLLNVAVLLVIGMVVIQLGMLGLYRLMMSLREPEPAARTATTIYEQLRTLRQTEEETLTTYGWVDREAGVVRIPIERAMDLVARRGVPKGKGPQTEAEVNSHSGKVEPEEKKP